MMRKLLILLMVCATGWSYAQTSLLGKVTDGDTKEPLLFASILVSKNGVSVTGTTTDLDGNYSISPLDPGTYDIEFSYTGYQSQRQTGVVVLAGKANELNISLSAGVMIDVVEITYQPPLIEKDNTSQGQVITSEQIRNLPTRNINALAATTAGLGSSDEGGAITIRGSRSNATDYYIDGIRVSGALIPESEIDQLQVVTGGIEAQYGDVTGGVISITTKGPSSKWSGGIEAETTEFFDDFDNRLIGFNLSGPLLKKNGKSLVGIRLAGRYTYSFDDDPPATEVFRIKDNVLAELEANPLIQRTAANGVTSNLVAADFLKADDVNILNASPFEENTRFDLTAKLDARLSDAVDVTFTGAIRDQENFFTPGPGTAGNPGGRWAVLNSHNNPVALNRTLRGNFRIRHRLGNTSSAAAGDTKESSVIQNAAYSLQFGYENNTGDTYDPRFEDRYFEYGHIGKFDIEWIPSFSLDFDGYRHTDYRQILRGYTPSENNPVLANYNNVLGLPTGENALNSTVPDFITFIFGNSTIGDPVALDNFLARNGSLSSQFNTSWGFHTNVGQIYNRVNKNDNDLYTFVANSSFEIVPKGKSDKGRHSIRFGIWYEQRTQRSYTVAPRNLWNVARQQANSHIRGIPENPDSIGVFILPETNIQFPGGVLNAGGPTALFDLAIDEGADNRFFREIREFTGQSLTEFVNVDGIDPSDLSLGMFSAKELNDENILGYYGYDYLGNEFNGTFDEFFTSTDADGVRTFPVAPNRPIYAAAYIQDKFTFRDIIFRVGVRVDRYDANTKVLKDNYSLYDIQGASDFHNNNPDLTRPGNIGDDFKVYTNQSGTGVQAYRDGDQWFTGNGQPVNSPIEIFEGGLVFPAYVDSRAETVGNYIKSREFDTDASFEDYEPAINVMPRLAFSFPISDDANFFAHYDILVQRPPSNTIATARNYFYFTDVSGIRNNPNLRPERTIDYEVGFQQRLSDNSAIKISAYYKEMRDMIQRRTFFPVPIVNSYETYDNLDFGTVKGFSFNYELRRTGNVSLTTNYTLQFADGTGSDANSQRGLTSRGNIRNLSPLSFDERHRINLVMDYRYLSGDAYTGPTFMGADILSKFGVNLQAIAVSGRPYTATVLPLKLGGTGFKGAINGARRPWNFTLNLRVDKSFDLPGRGDINAYVRVSNLLDRRNVVGVYSATGSAQDDGYLVSPNGLNEQATITNSARELDSFLASYQWALVNPNLFSLPRRVYLGVIFGF